MNLVVGGTYRMKLFEHNWYQILEIGVETVTYVIRSTRYPDIRINTTSLETFRTYFHESKPPIVTAKRWVLA